MTPLAEQTKESILKTLAWLTETRPDAIVFLQGQASEGVSIAPFYFPKVGWQSLSRTENVIALAHIPGIGWISTDESKSVDETLMLIGQAGRTVIVTGGDEPFPLEVLDVIQKLDMLLQPTAYTWN